MIRTNSLRLGGEAVRPGLGALAWAAAAMGALACGSIETLPVRSPSQPARTEGVESVPLLPWQTVERHEARVAEVAPVALVGATVLTATGREIVNGVLVIRGGRLEAIGAREATALPADAVVVELDGRFITPGLIDTHSHMGVYPVPYVGAHADGNEMTSPTTPEVMAADSFWPQDPALSHAVAAGVTTIQVLPGSANLIGGQGVAIKLLPGRSIEDMRIRSAPRVLKMACGENPKRVYGERKQAPSTRMGNVAGYRAAFQRAAEYRSRFVRWQHQYKRWAEGEAVSEKRRPQAPASPARDFGLDALVGVLEGEVLVQMHCYRADEMLRMLELADEFGFKIRAFHHAIEAYKIRDRLARVGTGVSTWVDWWGFKMEAYDTIAESPALLDAQGVRVALHSDSPSLIQRLNQEAGKAMGAAKRAGLEVTRDSALRWVTANAAWTLGLEDQTGTLEPGKMADVVVWNADPFSVYARPEQVYIDGVLAFHSVDRVRRPSDFELGQDAALDNGSSSSRQVAGGQQ